MSQERIEYHLADVRVVQAFYDLSKRIDPRTDESITKIRHSLSDLDNIGFSTSIDDLQDTLREFITHECPEDTPFHPLQIDEESEAYVEYVIYKPQGIKYLQKDPLMWSLEKYAIEGQASIMEREDKGSITK